MPRPTERESAALFPILCAVIALSLFFAMPIYRGLESRFSESRGLGAAMVMLREELNSNSAVAAFLGLPAPDAVSVSARPAGDLDAAVAAYIAAHTPTQAE
ncbi:MAG: hypothetical protein IJC15_08215 [Clostridia bacterium]|nr:hypothetical protein [Clostridia bacterium]